MLAGAAAPGVTSLLKGREDMEFSDQIRSIRKKEGLTQEAFADKVGVTRQAVSNWENDKNLPDIETVIRIAGIFHVSLDQLILGGEKDMNKMTEKLVKDGSEGRRAHMNRTAAAIGLVLMIMGLMCLFIKANSVEYVDASGMLHENFYLIPVGFLMIFAGAVEMVVTGAVSWVRTRKKEQSTDEGDR